MTGSWKVSCFKMILQTFFPNGIIRGHFESQYNSACFLEIGSRQYMLVEFTLQDPGYISYICWGLMMHRCPGTNLMSIILVLSSLSNIFTGRFAILCFYYRRFVTYITQVVSLVPRWIVKTFSVMHVVGESIFRNF